MNAETKNNLLRWLHDALDWYEEVLEGCQSERCAGMVEAVQELIDSVEAVETEPSEAAMTLLKLKETENEFNA